MSGAAQHYGQQPSESETSVEFRAEVRVRIGDDGCVSADFSYARE
jgi:hypothetical protein